MDLLAFETSIGNCSVALLYNGKKSYVESKNQMMQSEELIIMINDLLKENNIKYQDLDAVACSIGPGSFTGIRVGIAAARGIKKALPQIKLIGISTLDLIMHVAPKEIINSKQRILAILKSYGDEFYTQDFSSDSVPISEIRIMNEQTIIEDQHKYSLILSTAEYQIQTQLSIINANSVLKRAEMLYSNATVNDSIAPLYIQQPNIHQKKSL